MTERLYYNDSFLREFDAHVVNCVEARGKWEVTLDRTAFYPASGGQPNDLGTLGAANVLDVIDREIDHEILHLIDRPLDRGGVVSGQIDWQRRFDHLQQHTGQHLLSAAFIELFDIPTVSFHLGREISTIDLAASAITAMQLAEAERRTNQIIFEDRPINVLYGTSEQLAAAGIRKKVEREGILRAVEVEGFDRQPCGGTHASRTGQVGLIILRKFEKLKGNWRLEFVCGWRAARSSHADADALSSAARTFSCAPSDVPAVAAKIAEERQATHHERQRLIEQLADLQASALAQQAVKANGSGIRVISKLLQDADAAYARLLASKLVAEPGRRALLATTGGHVVFAQSSGADRDMNALLRECVSQQGGKGGGSHDFAQGSVPSPSRAAAVLDQALSILK
ncbi:MAG TPA: DHHA1 domain-containing protein [Candidatus Acidoferrales bacterium]|nr:DHHA1 domain-containing protein [Candidatus Acidoferrales bacterium]